MKAHTSADPTTKDGRNIDPSIGTLSGEAAQQEVKRPPETAYPALREAEHRIPDIRGEFESPTYYDIPMLKEPVWKPVIPLYFYVGGVSGAAGVLSGAVQLSGRPELQGLAKRCQWISTVGAITSAGLLIYDLGRPMRFIYMLRVFRPTSPMNVGTWILSSFGAAATGAALFQGMRGPLGRIGHAAGLVLGLTGGPLATYTGVLIANTAVPTWQGAHRWLPLLFGAGGIAGAASVLELLDATPEERRVIRRFAIAGQTAELLLSEGMRKTLKRQPRGTKYYEEGIGGALWQISKWATTASLALSILPGQQRWKRKASGWLGTLGAVSMRLAVYEAGKASARDPRASFEAQRARLADVAQESSAPPVSKGLEAIHGDVRTA